MSKRARTYVWVRVKPREPGPIHADQLFHHPVEISDKGRLMKAACGRVLVQVKDRRRYSPGHWPGEPTCRECIRFAYLQRLTDERRAELWSSLARIYDIGNQLLREALTRRPKSASR